MKKKIIIGCLLIILTVLLPNVNAINENNIQSTPDKTKFLVVGFFPKTTQELCLYYIIPGIIWSQVSQNNLIILWLGDFFILGITNERPEFWLGKMP